jgi:hypothetical protein
MHKGRAQGGADRFFVHKGRAQGGVAKRARHRSEPVKRNSPSGCTSQADKSLDGFLSLTRRKA